MITVSVFLQTAKRRGNNTEHMQDGKRVLSSAMLPVRCEDRLIVLPSTTAPELNSVANINFCHNLMNRKRLLHHQKDDGNNIHNQIMPR
jgi:hypothetical protein